MKIGDNMIYIIIIFFILLLVTGSIYLLKNPETEKIIQENTQLNKELEEKKGIGKIKLKTNDDKNISLTCPICSTEEFEINEHVFTNSHNYRQFSYVARTSSFIGFKCTNCAHHLFFKNLNPWGANEQSTSVKFQVSKSID